MFLVILHIEDKMYVCKSFLTLNIPYQTLNTFALSFLQESQAQSSSEHYNLTFKLYSVFI